MGPPRHLDLADRDANNNLCPLYRSGLNVTNNKFQAGNLQNRYFFHRIKLTKFGYMFDMKY